MRFSTGVVAALVAPMALAFVQPSLTQKKVAFSTSAFEDSTRFSTEQKKAMTELQMAFDLKDGQVSNMFDGPTPLVKERDACGVGFIANTKSGGEVSSLNVNDLIFHIISMSFTFINFSCDRRVWNQ